MSTLSLSEDQAKAVIHASGITRQQQVLILTAVGEGGKQIDAIKKIALDVGLRAATKWNLSDILRKSRGLTINTPKGWELSAHGAKIVAELASIGLPSTVSKKVAMDVRRHLGAISSDDAKEFIEEAVQCLEHGQYRAAVVFSWVGAMSILHDSVVKNHLVSFNIEALRRDSKWKTAKNSDDLGRMTERNFLDVLEAIGLIGNNVKQTLQNQCLKLRNGCGHPSSLKIGELAVAAHIELLVLNVYSKSS
jgi:hypothetical protein